MPYTLRLHLNNEVMKLGLKIIAYSTFLLKKKLQTFLY